MTKSKRFLFLDHFDPDDLTIVKGAQSKIDSFLDDAEDIIAEDISDTNGLYLVAHTDDSIILYECKACSQEEVKAKMIQEVNAKLAELNIPVDIPKKKLNTYVEGCDIELVDSIKDYTICLDWYIDKFMKEHDSDDVKFDGDFIVNEVFLGIEDSSVDGDSGSKYEFMLLTPDHFDHTIDKLTDNY